MISFRSDEIETAAAFGDPRVVDFARSLRAETVRAADDLSALVNDLRTPLGYAPCVLLTTMRGIADIVRSHRTAGVRIETMILLEGLDIARDLLHQCVYRLVQEGLTNAVKHAPGSSFGCSSTAPRATVCDCASRTISPVRQGRSPATAPAPVRPVCASAWSRSEVRSR